jgi:hypothetical protein
VFRRVSFASLIPISENLGLAGSDCLSLSLTIGRVVVNEATNVYTVVA